MATEFIQACSFCGISKIKAENKLLIAGPANKTICITCVKKAKHLCETIDVTKFNNIIPIKA